MRRNFLQFKYAPTRLVSETTQKIEKKENEKWWWRDQLMIAVLTLILLFTNITHSSQVGKLYIVKKKCKRKDLP